MNHLLNAAALTGILALASPTYAGQTYTWTGGGGNELWSNSANWQEGSVPASSPDTTLVFPYRDGGENDLADFLVGTVHVGSDQYMDAAFTIEGLPFVIQREFDLSAIPESVYMAAPFELATPARLEGDVALRAWEVEMPWSGFGPVLSLQNGWGSTTNIAGSGNLTIAGAVRMDDALDWDGTVTVAEDGMLSLFQFSADRPLEHLRVDGVLDGSQIFLKPGATADLRGGIVNTTGNAGALPSVYGVGPIRVDGSILLGEWVLDGIGYYSPGTDSFIPDQIHATGTLDLTQAVVSEGGFGFELEYETDDIPAFITLGTYGQRIGALPIETLRVDFYDSATGAPVFGGDFPIIYTSGENDGPGEIRVLLPEPAATGALLFAGLLLGRVRRAG